MKAAVWIFALFALGFLAWAVMLPADDGDPTAAAPQPVERPESTERPESAERPEPVEGLADLRVTAERNSATYEREQFGDYDRDALLAVNFDNWPECDGYYSVADDQCYTSDDAVEVDHIVALGEAWRSGASEWNEDRRDQFAADPANLWLMTAALNSSKSDQDPTDWLPEHGACGYTKTYIAVKAKYDLAVDRAEHDALSEAC